MLLQDYPDSRHGSSEASQSLQHCSARRELLLCMADSLSSVQDFGSQSLAATGDCPKCSVSLIFTFLLASKMDYACRFRNFWFALSSVIRVLSEINSNGI